MQPETAFPDGFNPRLNINPLLPDNGFDFQNMQPEKAFPDGFNPRLNINPLLPDSGFDFRNMQPEAILPRTAQPSVSPQHGIATDGFSQDFPSCAVLSV
jgi:hypothetical protein